MMMMMMISVLRRFTYHW